MKNAIRLTLASTTILWLGTSLSAADPRPGSHCVELSPDAEELVSLVANELLQGTSAYLVAYLERPDDPISGRPTSGPNTKGVFLFKTPSGSLLVRMVDLPPGLGWAGPF